MGSIDSSRGIESAQARIPNVESDQIRRSACCHDSLTNHKMMKLASGNRPFRILTMDRVMEQQRERAREKEIKRFLPCLSIWNVLRKPIYLECLEKVKGTGCHTERFLCFSQTVWLHSPNLSSHCIAA